MVPQLGRGGQATGSMTQFSMPYARKVSPLDSLLLMWIVLILYGSFFPFHFSLHRLHHQPLTALLQSRTFLFDRFVVRDFFVNVTLYVPLGVLWWLKGNRTGKARTAVPIVGGLLLSCLVEVGQYVTETRTSSVFDVACNVAGTGLGVLMARLSSARLRRLEERLVASGMFRAPANLLLLACWVGYEIVPLFPALSRTKVAAKIAYLKSTASLSLVATTVAWTEWLAVAWLLGGVVKPQQPWLLALLLLMPARLFLEGRMVSMAELIGGALAVATWSLALRRPTGRTRIVAASLLAGILLSGLRPFHFADTPSAFSWVPFSGALLAEREFGLPELLRKTFVYGTSIWLLEGCGIALVASAFAVATMLGAIEAVQVYLPGRTAEITDPVLALGVAYALSLATRARGRAAGGRPVPDADELSGDQQRATD
jgi:glycopeptide antibiotics resistance protein